ncbi:HlyD family type I secretion periplasmic adaptor subunit [Blastochloris tepida]|jgi:HlyD family type I secretion membrane fusion protein|uniref:Membrane fusion protein (MFP) family protein n=1 Tax=Blastochloris tepida TaxID=2233851 RepID=A0A348G234_9HYPH|nr:HlyD family type I secretion periplasmic adaptor subunit [Blastochloris tepida]BBF93617.1 RsaA secretion system, membrane protein RsaE [Blastochloris tepida]
MDEQRIELLPAPPVSTDWRRLLLIGFAVVFFTFFVLGGWAAIARLDAAVVATAKISVESNRKTVQHLEGGIVKEILVRDGDAVKEGDVLVRLDPTRSEATSRAYRQQLAIALALEARLAAQRDMLDKVAFPKEVLDMRGDPQVAVAISDNQRQFENRRETLTRGIDVIERQIVQVRQEIEQSQVDVRSAQERVATINRELPNLRRLLERGLVPLPRVTALERELSQAQGALDNGRLSIDKGKAKTGEYQARIEQLRQEYRQEAANLLPDVQRTIGDARQQLVIASDALRRIDIKAPVTGTVQQMRIFTIGGVIRAGDPIVDIVPAADSLVVRAQISPYDRDRVHVGLPVEVRVPQFAKYQLAPITGQLRAVSQDSIPDEATRQMYFAAEVVVDKASIPPDLADKLTAGMQVDVVIPTEARTVLSYLMGPMLHNLALSMRER